MWNNMIIEPDKTYYWNIGQKEIYVKKTGREWLFSIDKPADPKSEWIYGELKEPGEEAKWSTYVDDENSNLLVVPAFPDRPIVVRPGSTLKVMPKKSLLLFVQVPIWVQYYSKILKYENLIVDVPASELSSIWFGEKDKGTLAYRLDIDILSALKKPDANMQHIVCPVQLINVSDEKLDIQRLLLNCENLNVYYNGVELWANELKIKFKGENETSEVQNLNQAPGYIPNAKLLNYARVSKSKNMFLKTFHFIKSFTNY
jgi:hypothetical protein